MSERAGRLDPVRDRLDSLRSLLDSFRDRLDHLQQEVTALAVALVDSRTPWYARGVIALTVGLAASPIDPVPDFVPVLGYLDDLVFIPAGVLLARTMVPEEVFVTARERAADGDVPRWLGWGMASLVVIGWLVTAALLVFVVGLPWT